MKRHDLNNKQKYRSVHVWLVNNGKINLYSNELIQAGDKIEHNGNILAVVKVSASKPNPENEHLGKHFYELEVK